MGDPTFITRVRLKNYKSIADCDVKLGPLQFLVGPNGSGKSNFLDAIRLVVDSLKGTVTDAINSRGGITEVLYHSAERALACEVDLGFRTANEILGNYRIAIGPAPRRLFSVQKEELTFCDRAGQRNFYTVESGRVIQSSAPNPPAAALDRLYLVHASGLAAFRPVYDAMTRMEFYNLNLDRIREIKASTPGETLARDGHNLANILLRLHAEAPEVEIRIEEYLKAMLPGLIRLGTAREGPTESICYVQFWQRLASNQPVTSFMAENMSDGTLRALGILVATFQFAGGELPGSLVGIEEPETALHPAAAGILREALREASETTQVIVTSHSPDLLDDKSVTAEEILAVSLDDGSTRIGPLDAAGREAIRTRLYTPGELLRMNQLQPEHESLAQLHPNTGRNGA